MSQQRTFAAFAIEEAEKKKSVSSNLAALSRVNAKRLANKLKPELECLALAGLFGGINETQKTVESYLSKLLESRKICDYAVVNSTRPIDLERNNFRLDIMIKPVQAANFIYLPMRIERSGVMI